LRPSPQLRRALTLTRRQEKLYAAMKRLQTPAKVHWYRQRRTGEEEVGRTTTASSGGSFVALTESGSTLSIESFATAPLEEYDMDIGEVWVPLKVTTHVGGAN
jgi:hypothetical protein